MKVAILHHHLHPGGVTKVIQEQIKSLELSPSCSVELFLGEAPDQSPSIPLHILPLCKYLDPKSSRSEDSKHLQQLKDELSKSLSSFDLIHVHNLNLGKNPLLTLALYHLSQQGLNIFNHCHDFAEDGRQANLDFLKLIIEEQFKESLNNVLYTPLNSYGCLNNLDYQFLLEQNLKPDQVFLLPNPISPPPELPNVERKELLRPFGINPQKEIWLYPVRAIQRKNIGEILLLSLLFKEDIQLIITQAPKNPKEIPLYQSWVKLTKELACPVFFEMGDKIDFHSLMALADQMVTTSIQEGFGMTYLEPWLYHKRVVGRNLKRVTEDFVENGLQFPFLYPQISLPNGKDFADESQEDQVKWIKKASEDINFRLELIENNKLQQLRYKTNTPIIEQNKQLITQQYSLAAYRKKIDQAYGSLL